MKTLLKFQADWCGPCHAIAKFVDEIVAENDLELEIIDIDNQLDKVSEWEVSSIPTLILVEDNKEIARHTGAAPKSRILAGLGL